MLSGLKEPLLKLSKKTQDEKTITLAKSSMLTSRRLSLEKEQTPPVQKEIVTLPIPQIEDALTIQPSSSSSRAKENEQLSKRKKSRIVSGRDKTK